MEEINNYYVCFTKTREKDTVYNMQLNYKPYTPCREPEKCGKYVYEEPFVKKNYMKEPEQNKKVTSTFTMEFAQKDFDKIEKVFESITGKKIVDLKSCDENTTMEKIFDKMHKTFSDIPKCFKLDDGRIPEWVKEKIKNASYYECYFFD